MEQPTTGEMTLAGLAKKVDEQARFTRSVSLITMLTILGVQFYTLTEMNSTLPKVILLELMGNLEKVVLEWKAAETSITTRQSQGQPPLR